MKERPIIFSGPMVRALLAGTKTQTRRIVKARDLEWMDVHQGLREPDNAERCPYGQPVDRLWVRESFMPTPLEAAPGPSQTPWSIAYAAGGQAELLAPSKYNPMLYNYERWTPSIHMPRWASRITLEITSVSVERLQDISEADALAEGVADDGSLVTDLDGKDRGGAIAAYATLWEVINGVGSWDDNHWVWVIDFRRLS